MHHHAACISHVFIVPSASMTVHASCTAPPLRSSDELCIPLCALPTSHASCIAHFAPHIQRTHHAASLATPKPCGMLHAQYLVHHSTRTLHHSTYTQSIMQAPFMHAPCIIHVTLIGHHVSFSSVIQHLPCIIESYLHRALYAMHYESCIRNPGRSILHHIIHSLHPHHASRILHRTAINIPHRSCILHDDWSILLEVHHTL